MVARSAVAHSGERSSPARRSTGSAVASGSPAPMTSSSADRAATRLTTRRYIAGTAPRAMPPGCRRCHSTTSATRSRRSLSVALIPPRSTPCSATRRSRRPAEAKERLLNGTRSACARHGCPEKFDASMTARWSDAVGPPSRQTMRGLRQPRSCGRTRDCCKPICLSDQGERTVRRPFDETK